MVEASKVVEAGREVDELARQAPQNFEAGIDELDQLIQLLESGSLPLEEALQAYKRGAQLLQSCQQLLQSAEAQIKILEGDVLQAFSVDFAAEKV